MDFGFEALEATVAAEGFQRRAEGRAGDRDEFRITSTGSEIVVVHRYTSLSPTTVLTTLTKREIRVSFSEFRFHAMPMRHSGSFQPSS
jgi:hypothetical protein